MASKKRLDFLDFKNITEWVYQGKNSIPEIKNYILYISYTMNNFRLSTNKELNPIDFNTLNLPLINHLLSLPSMLNYTKEGLVIETGSGKVYREIYIVEEINKNNETILHPSVSSCAQSLNVARSSVITSLNKSKPLIKTGTKSLKRIRVYT
jgi:hypothetical protein